SLDLAAGAKVPQLLPFMVRRIASSGTAEAMELLVGKLGQIKGPQGQLVILNGIKAALKGQRQVNMPPSWPATFTARGRSTDAEVRSRAQALAVTCGDPQAFAAMRTVLADRKALASARQAALATLLAARDPELAPTLHALLNDPNLRRTALSGLAQYDHSGTPAALLVGYGSWSPVEKRDALGTLTSRAAYGRALLAAVAAKKVPATDLTADLIRQLRNLGDPTLDKQIAAVWGTVRETAADKAKLIARYKTLIADK